MIEHEARQDRINKFRRVDEELQNGAEQAAELGDTAMLATFEALRLANREQIEAEQLTEEVSRNEAERE